jgi:uncharacterized protein
MTTYYLDTSALIKRYVTETGSEWVQSLFDSKEDHLFITSRLTMPEAFSAFARRLRENSVTVAQYNMNIDLFRDDSSRTYKYVELTLDVINLSRHLLEKHPLRANDAVQLASAILANRLIASASMPQVRFLCADNNLISVATAEGLLSENPNEKI